MRNPLLWLLFAVLAAPAIAYLIYRLAQGLGFLEPPRDRQQELKRAILASLYTFLLFFPVLIYGFEKGWPRAWVVFGIFNGLVLLFFAASGLRSAIQLWRLRHPELAEPEALPAEDEATRVALRPAESRRQGEPPLEIEEGSLDSRPGSE